MHNTKFSLKLWLINVERIFCSVKVRSESFLVEETESHVVIGFLLWFFFLFFLDLFGGSSSRGSSGTGSNVGNEVLDVDGLEALGEKAGPERLNGDVSGLQDGVDLLSCDGDVIVGEDQAH